jgi:hypothetical protein
MTPLAAAIIIAGGIAATSAAFAEDTPATNPAPQGQGMMGGQQGQGMMGENGGMMGMMNMMPQMTRMAAIPATSTETPPS